MDRRTLLHSALAGLFGAQLPALLARSVRAPGAPATPPSPSASTGDRAGARPRPTTPFERPVVELSEPFADLTYDQFRGIRFRD